MEKVIKVSKIRIIETLIINFLLNLDWGFITNVLLLSMYKIFYLKNKNYFCNLLRFKLFIKYKNNHFIIN